MLDCSLIDWWLFGKHVDLDVGLHIYQFYLLPGALTTRENNWEASISFFTHCNRASNPTENNCGPLRSPDLFRLMFIVALIFLSKVRKTMVRLRCYKWDRKGWNKGDVWGVLEVIRSPTCPTAAASSPPLSSLLPWLVSMCRAQGLENEWRPGSAWSLKPARNARPLFSLSLSLPRCSAVAAACSSEIFPLLLSLCIWELDVIGRPIIGSHWADAGLGGGRKDWIEVFLLISDSPGYLVQFGFRGRTMLWWKQRMELIQLLL